MPLEVKDYLEDGTLGSVALWDAAVTAKVMLNGWIIANFKLNTMIVTLGTQTFFTGITMGLLELKEITSTLPVGFRTLGESYLFEVHNSAGLRSTMTTMFLFFVALCIITSFILNKTMFGRALYAIGGNEVSAERAGYNVKKVKFLLYSTVGAVSGFIGMETLDLLRDTAASIANSADCSVGVEAAKMVLKGMEAALRTCYAVATGKNPEPDAFRAVRGIQGWKEAEFDLAGRKIRTAVVSGLGQARQLIEALRAGTVAYDFVEVMAVTTASLSLA